MPSETDTVESGASLRAAPASRDKLASQVETLTRLHELAMALGGVHDELSAMRAILDTAVECQGADYGLVWLQEATTGDLVVRASRNFDGAKARLFERVPAGPAGGAAGNAFHRKSRWAVEDTETDESFAAYRCAAREAGIRAVHSTPIVTRSGSLLGVLSLHFKRPCRLTQRDQQISDVCARHAADALEAMRSQQALSLEVERLRRAENELRELDQRKNEFLATLAHELRNPLAPLRNGLEVLRLAGHDEALARKARSMMERQLAQMVRLVDDLLDVSRVSRGKIELRRAHVDLATVLRNALETSQPMMDERRHELVVDVPPRTIGVDADLTRLSQVFWNLLNNAAKYTEPGGRIEVRARLQGGEARVSVRDNGIGIPPAMQARVFDIFTQVDRALEKSQGGLGIGLSIARKLVEMHGGHLEVRSEGHRKGSEFIVSLPAWPLAERDAAPRETLEPARRGARHRVLVADDNADSASTLSLMLEAMGHEVRVACDGEEAVRIACEYRPDTILMDIGMPRLNGFEACAAIRREPWAAEAFIVALTGWGQEEDKARSREAGFDRHLVKPVEPLLLERLIQALPSREAAPAPGG